MNPDCYVIDIGTNSARLMSATLRDEKVYSIYKMLRTVRTGEGMRETHRISEAAIGRILVAMTEFRNRIDEETFGIPVYCFATSAVRDAENSGELVAAILNAAGFHLHILSGEEEAEIGFLGAVPGGTGGLIDIGGGSTEIVVGTGGNLHYRRSFDAGAVRCLEMFGSAGDPEGVSQTMRWAKELFPVRKEHTIFTGIGGTITTCAAILQKMEVYDSQKIQGSRITLAEVSQLLRELTSMPIEQRRALAGLQPKRADIIPYGLAILVAIMENLSLEQIFVSDADNLEGYAVKYVYGNR